MTHALQRIWSPALYQGAGVTRRYFEGWYFKQVDADARRVLAVIPGVSYAEDGTSSHAFVQIVPGGGTMHYFTYPIESFAFATREPFSVTIGESTFSRSGMRLRLHDDVAEVTGDLSYGPWVPWPVTALSPGIMGWYRFVPRMETYHGVLSMDHEVSGSVRLGADEIIFDGGRGYVEKDWGRSFPSSWIWAQSNHFGRPDISVTASVAKIPWMTGAFVGTIAGLLLDGALHRFATYTGARLASLETGVNTAHVILRDRRQELELRIEGRDALILKAPTLGAMEGHAAESLGGTIEVTLRGLRGGRVNEIYRGTGTQAGVEVMNDRGELGV